MQVDDTEMQYILYGAGEVGCNALKLLRKNTGDAFCFFDKRAKGMIEGVEIFDPFEVNVENKDSKCVIICLSDGVQHKPVADELYVLGYNYIIFLPVAYDINHEEKKRLTILYNNVLKGNLEYNLVESYDCYYNPVWNDNVMIAKDKESFLVWLSQEILFSEDIASWKYDKAKVHIINNGVPVNLQGYYWYHDLFSYLDGRRSDCLAYTSIFNPEQDSKKNDRILRNREVLYREFLDELNYGLDFFINAAPETVWNPKGYFHIVGGNHRTIFLQHMGYKFYPLKVNPDDYNKWKNQDAFDDVRKYIETNKIESTMAPVPHPCFRTFKSKREQGKETLFSVINRLFGTSGLTGKRVLDASGWEGYFARICSRMQTDCVYFYPLSIREYELSNLLFSLLYVNDVTLLKGINYYDVNEVNVLFLMQNIELLHIVRHFSSLNIVFMEYKIEEKKAVADKLKDMGFASCTPIHQEFLSEYQYETSIFER